MASVEKVPMLAEGYERLQAQLTVLKAERPLIVDAIEEARAHGDLSENAEYHAAKERQGQVEATIADLEGKLSRAQIIDPASLSDTFPSVGPDPLLATFRLDIDDERLLAETRPDGAELRVTGDVPPAVPPRSKSPRPTVGLIRSAEHAEAVRNEVRAAILRTKVADALPEGSTKHRKAAKAAIV